MITFSSVATSILYCLKFKIPPYPEYGVCPSVLSCLRKPFTLMHFTFSISSGSMIFSSSKSESQTISTVKFVVSDASSLYAENTIFFSGFTIV